jgi:hypothetical protein
MTGTEIQSVCDALDAQIDALTAHLPADYAYGDDAHLDAVWEARDALYDAQTSVRDIHSV